MILLNKYYTFVTSPFLAAGPSPAPFCSIFKAHQCLTWCLRCGSSLLSDHDTKTCLPLRRTHQKDLSQTHSNGVSWGLPSGSLSGSDFWVVFAVTVGRPSVVVYEDFYDST